MVEPRPGLRDTPPYRAPQHDVPVRLNTNECPYALPEAFLRELAEAVRSISFNRYPDRDAETLRHVIAETVGHSTEGVWAANGSNEIIQQLLLAYGGPGRRAVVFEPTYLLHRHIAWMANTDVVRVEVAQPFIIDEDHIRTAAQAGAHVVFVCSPNNPTGNAQPVDAIEALAEATDALVIVDEAYIEFGGKSAVHLVASRPNVAVVRTFSKAFALAAARVGYCLT